MAVIPLPPPPKVVLPVSQHIGAPAKPVVAIGDKVVLGQKIADPGGFVSAPVHATVSGKVVGVGNFLHPLGIPQLSIVIETDPSVPDPSFSTIEDGLSLSPEDIKKRIQEAGIVGLGGATFPTHVKLSPPPGKPIDSVILNGVECEPGLTSDHRTMVEEPDKIVQGLRLFMRVLNAKQGFIGIEANKPDAIRLFQEKLQGSPNLSVVPLEVKYPQGGEKQLIVAVLGREVPSGGLPLEVGVVVQNVATAAAVHDAVCMKKPLLERVVTLAGKSALKPGNYRTRIGTLVSHFVQTAGGLKPPVRKVIMGGPMMGTALFDLDVPIIKGTGGLLCWDETQVSGREEKPCIRCGRCIDGCPMNLMPQRLRLLVDSQKWAEADSLGAMDCMECGCCSFACPAHLPLVQGIKLGKRMIAAERKREAQKAKA